MNTTPNQTTQIEEAWLYYRRGSYSAAARLFRQLLANRQARVQACLGLAHVHRAQHQWGEAENALETALQFDPACDEAKRALAAVHRESTRGDKQLNEW